MSDITKAKGADKATVDYGLLVIYLVWSWRPNSSGGFYQLESVSLTKEHAAYAKACAKNRGRKVVVEKSLAEHLFGASMSNCQSGDEPPVGFEGVDVG